jgi:hypothetical protein
MKKLIQPIACSDHLFAWNPVFLLAGSLLFDEKIRCAALFWFGLRDVGIRYSRAVIQRTVDVYRSLSTC